MKGLVLAGGDGRRLRPITHTAAKQLVPVANKPILFYGLEQLRDAGITDIGIVVGDRRDEISAAVDAAGPHGISVTYLDQPDPLGLAHAVLVARDFLGDDDFVMFLGDNLIEGGIADLVDGFAASDEDARVLLKQVEDPRRFGVAELADDGSIRRLVEKPQEPPSDLALVGVYLFRRSIIDAADAIEPSARGELEITDAIQWLLDHGHDVRSTVHEGWWLDTGKKDELLDANRILLGTVTRRIDGDVDDASEVVGDVVVEAGARIVRSRVRGPAAIGAGATVTDSYVGPFTSVAADCTVTESELENSVVLDRARIDGVARLEGSLVGRDVTIERSTGRPAATRVVLGDHSRLEL